MARRLDIVGHKYDRLTVLSYHSTYGGKRHFNCRCVCGNITISSISALRNGKTRSCGCLQREMAKIYGGSNRTHGLSKNRVYQIWAGIKKRCRNKKAQKYHLYGGRGILMDDRWLNSFDEFFKDMGLPPSNKHSIERIDSNGNYTPSNCKWATQREQCNNTSRNRFLSIKGEKITLTNAARMFNIPEHRLRGRLNRGWSVDQAVSLKLRERIKNI